MKRKKTGSFEVLKKSRHEIEVIPPKTYGDYKLKHKYSRVAVYVPDELLLFTNRRIISKYVKLVQEQDNKYDKHAVAVYDGRYKIGYLRIGKYQDKCNEWINTNLPIVSMAVEYNPREGRGFETGQIRIFIALYA